MSRAPARKKTPAIRKLKPFWIPITAAAAVLAGAGYWAAFWPGFYPQRISVSGNAMTPRQAIIDRAAIAADRNVWLQNMHAAASRIERLPYVKTARIRRTFPANVRIEITERFPFALIRTGAGLAVVDADLRVLQPARYPTGLPVLNGGLQVREARPGSYLRDASVARLAHDYATLANAHVAVAALFYDRFGDLVAVTPKHVRLLLGDERDLPAKAALVDPVLSQTAGAGRKIAAVDLRAPGTPVVVYR